MAGRMAFLKDNKDWEATAKVRRYRADWCFFSPISFCSSFFPDFIWCLRRGFAWKLLGPVSQLSKN
jgi:hypothetical protein